MQKIIRSVCCFTDQPGPDVFGRALVQALSAKYKKPLSVRFVSDGKARIGERTKFTSPYLKNVEMRRL